MTSDADDEARELPPLEIARVIITLHATASGTEVLGAEVINAGDPDNMDPVPLMTVLGMLEMSKDTLITMYRQQFGGGSVGGDLDG